MKITDSEIIKNGEQELIDAITADLDWGAIEEVFLKEHNLGIEEDIEYKSGDIVAVDNQIAYKLEFEVKVNLSVLINRNGEYLSVNISNRHANPEEDVETDISNEPAGPETDADIELQTEEPVYESIDEETAGEENDNLPDDTDEIQYVTNDGVEDIEESISEDRDFAPFGDLSDSSSDDMGQKVDDILENIKKAG